MRRLEVGRSGCAKAAEGGSARLVRAAEDDDEDSETR